MLFHLILNVSTNVCKEFSSADYEAVLDGWKEKVVRTSQGFQKWGAFYAEKKEA